DRADETLRVVGEHRRDVYTRVDQPARHLRGLVRRDATRYAEYDPVHLRRQRSGAFSRPVSALDAPQAVASPSGSTAASTSATSATAASVSSAGSMRRPRILPTATSSRAIESGLRETEVTCGGTMRPRPSPNWL